MSSRLLERVAFLGLSCSNRSASASDLVCALGVADQSRAGGIEVVIGGGETGLVENLFEDFDEFSAIDRYGGVDSLSSLWNGGDSTATSDRCEGVGVDRRIEGGDLRAWNDSNPWGACMTEFGCSSSSELDLTLSAATFFVSSFKSRSPSLGVCLGCGIASSVARPVSSISVVSVPFDDGAIGEGS